MDIEKLIEKEVTKLNLPEGFQKHPNINYSKKWKRKME